MTDNEVTYIDDAGNEYTMATIIFEGNFEVSPDYAYSQERARELAESGRKVTVVNALRDNRGELVALQYEAVINVTVAEPASLEDNA